MSALIRAGLVTSMASLAVVTAFVLLGRGSPVGQVVALILLAVFGPVAVGFVGGFVGRTGSAALGSLAGALVGGATAMFVTGEPIDWEGIATIAVVYVTVVVAAHFLGVAMRAVWAV